MRQIEGIFLLQGRKKPWRVRFQEDGKRKAIHFHTKGEAEAWVKLSNGQQWEPADEITDEEKMLIKWARSKAGDNGPDFAIAISQFLKSSAPPQTVILSEAFERYKKDMERRGVRKAYAKNATYIINRFIWQKESWAINRIAPEDIVSHCLALSSGVEDQNTIRTRLVTFFNWAKEQGWTEIDTKQIKWRRPKANRKPIGFLHPAEVQTFLDATPPKLQFPFALLFLTGIRPSGEFMGLRYDNIDRKSKVIHIPETISKTRQYRRLYNLPESLWEWYDHSPNRRHGKICPMTYRNTRAHVAKICEKTGVKWTQDCTRHTFATCAFHIGLEWSLDIMGHADSRLFLKHYKGLITPEEAAKLWLVRPKP